MSSPIAPDKSPQKNRLKTDLKKQSSAKKILLQSKLFIPLVKPKQLVRKRFFQQLDQALNYKLTLVEAAAGYGKTSLLSQWAANAKQQGLQLSWVTLDDADNDPVLFGNYFVQALQKIFSDAGTSGLSVLNQEGERVGQAAVFSLLNDLASAYTRQPQQQGVLVLDDVHKLHNEYLLNSIDLLLEYLPGNVHLIMAGRRMPELSLTKMRAEGSLAEVKSEKIGFSRSEAAAFINESHELGLSQPELDRLYRRTEGWPTGIQLAVLAIKEQQANRLEAVSGLINDNQNQPLNKIDHRYAVEYLMGEVFESLSTDVQRFLFAAAVPNRFSAELCARLLLDQADTEYASAEVCLNSCRQGLSVLSESHMFINALDVDHGWFRLHDLFRQSIQQRLCADKLLAFQRSAAKEFERQGFWAETLELSLDTADWSKAAELIEQYGFEWLNAGRYVTVNAWLMRLPPNYLEQHCALVLLQLGVWAQAKVLSLNATERYLAVAAQLLAALSSNATATGGTKTADKSTSNHTRNKHLLEAQLRLVESAWARTQGNISHSLALSKTALAHAQEESLPLQSKSYFALGMSEYLRGDIKAGSDSVSQALRLAKQEQDFDIVVSASVRLAWVYQWQGQFKLAYQVYADSRAFLANQKQLSASFICWQNLALAAMHREFNDLGLARECLDNVQQQMLDDPSFAITAPLNLCKLSESEGDYDAALQALGQAERLYLPIANSVQGFPSIPAMRAKIAVLQNDAEAVKHFVSHTGLAVQHARGYRHEEERITLARCWIFLGKVDGALFDLIDNIVMQATQGNHVSNLVVLHILAAMAYWQQDDKVSCVERLKIALPLAARCGYVRLVVDERPHIQAVLQLALDHDVEPFYSEQCLTLLHKEQPLASLDPGQSSTLAAVGQLIEPLSQREQEVLALMDVGLQNKHIAEKLFIGTGTVKTHVRNILAKLAVQNRTQAVSRARDLGLLS